MVNDPIAMRRIEALSVMMGVPLAEPRLRVPPTRAWAPPATTPESLKSLKLVALRAAPVRVAGADGEVVREARATALNSPSSGTRRDVLPPARVSRRKTLTLTVPFGRTV